jgi:ubiquinol-cytochrome c reductase cytochrome b subunit
LFFIFIIQLISGIFIRIIYSNVSSFAFSSVEYCIRNIIDGNLIRLIHLNTASLFFLFLYLHIFRGLIFTSFKFKNTWRSGVSIILILILTAFIGYVLPWGQISFWAATVITKFLSAIPIWGNIILIWVWRSFSVGDSTLKFFFSLHYLFPIILFLIIIFHFIALHFKGSRSKISTRPNIGKTKFSPFFLFKDFLNFIFIFFIFIVVNLWLTREGENFIIANPRVTPAHIKPEWYFLFAYAILRSIPHKFRGVLIIALSIIFLYFFSFLISKYTKKNFQLTLWFIVIFIALSWIGYNEAVDIFVIIGLILTFLYFLILIFYIIFNLFSEKIFF